MVTCGISDSFESLSPTSGQITYVLLSRSPLAFPLAGIGSSDLHVLCTPPAFVLSQDQTLRQKIRPPFRAVLLKLRVRSKNQRDLAWRSCHSSAVKDRAPTSHWNSAYGRDADATSYPSTLASRQSRGPPSVPRCRLFRPRPPPRRYGAAQRPALPHRAAAGTSDSPFPHGSLPSRWTHYERIAGRPRTAGRVDLVERGRERGSISGIGLADALSHQALSRATRRPAPPVD